MSLRSTSEDWGTVAKILHWIMAAGILTMLCCGIVMAYFTDHDIGLKFTLYQFHKSLGFCLLCIALARIAWRLSASDTPKLTVNTNWTQRRLAQSVHVGLYSCLVVQPLLGWSAASASPLNIPTVIFGLFALPRLGGADATREHLLSEAHAFVAWLLIGLLVLHIAGAVWHHLILKDDTLRRMSFNHRRTAAFVPD